MEDYDPKTDTWAKKTNMPISNYLFSTSVVKGKIYIIGGVAGFSSVKEYDPATDKYNNKANMPTGRYCFGTSVVKDNIYAIWHVYCLVLQSLRRLAGEVGEVAQIHPVPLQPTA